MDMPGCSPTTWPPRISVVLLVDGVVAGFGRAGFGLAVDQDAAPVLGHLEQVPVGAQVLRSLFLPITPQPRAQQLAGGQVAGGHDHEGGLARELEFVQLAMHPHVVQRRVGTGVGGEDQAFVHLDADAIGHVGVL